MSITLIDYIKLCSQIVVLSHPYAMTTFLLSYLIWVIPKMNKTRFCSFGQYQLYEILPRTPPSPSSTEQHVRALDVTA